MAATYVEGNEVCSFLLRQVQVVYFPQCQRYGVVDRQRLLKGFTTPYLHVYCSRYS